MNPNMNAIENAICARLVRDAIAAGYTVTVWEGGDFAIKASRDAGAILAAMASTGEDVLQLRRADGSKAGIVLLIYGNDADIVSDHSDNADMRALLDPIQAYANLLDDPNADRTLLEILKA